MSEISSPPLCAFFGETLTTAGAGAWLIKTDANGTKEWDKIVGGIDKRLLPSSTPTPSSSPTPTPIIPVKPEMKVWFNGEQLLLGDADYYGRLSVKNMPQIRLKIGEPVEVKVEVVSKGAGKVKTMLEDQGTLTEGYGTPRFDVLSGPTEKLDNAVDVENVTDGWSKVYTWRIAPNGNVNDSDIALYAFAWSGDIVSTASKGKEPTTEVIKIANVHVVGERYSGDSTMAKQPSNGQGSLFGGQYLIYIAVGAMVVVILAALLLRRRKAKYASSIPAPENRQAEPTLY